MLLKIHQVWCSDYFPGEPVPACDHTLSEEPLPAIQPEPPLLQLESYDVFVYLYAGHFVQ